MPLLRFENVSLAYGHLPLLAHVNFQIESGERVCLVGRNGAGKTTMLRVMTGAAVPDDGKVWRQETLRIAHLEQEVPPETEKSIFEVVAAGLGELGALLTDYHHAAQLVSTGERATLDRLAQLHARIDSLDGWNINQRVAAILTRLGLPADTRLADCSGGTRRQVMLASALVCDPDLLLLDEPTNHLDISAITWLEKYLLSYNGALVFITHDRTFLRRLATRIIDLDRGNLVSFPGDFDSYLAKKDELLEIETRANVKFDKKLAEEEDWIRRGVKARRTRNEGRVKALQAMRRRHAARLAVQGKARFGIDSGELSGKLVADLRRVSFRYEDNLIIRELSTRIMRGDRVGIIGPNGSGKSTLLRLILGEFAPTSGDVVMGSRLQLAYFDQHRRLLDPDKSVRENLSDSNHVMVRGRSRHVTGYLKDFLFPPARLDSPVRALSGGERNRLLLAKIFTQPANLLVLDEPTNDLDVDTLELLEDLLADYEGTLLLVSHDRTFLDNVVTSTLVFEGDGKVGEFAGGYEDWERYRQHASPRAMADPKREAAPPPVTSANTLPVEKPRKLTYKEQRELAALPARIESLEVEQSALHTLMGTSAFYRQESRQIQEAMVRLETLDKEIMSLYQRWGELLALGESRN